MKKPDRNAIRRQLLEHGYEPLPLNGKACYVKGWSFAEIDEAFIKEHARKAAWLNTGIRCGNVVGIDIDIDDPLDAEAAEAIVEDVLGATPFCRFGRGEKRLLLYWTDTPTPKRRTGRYTAPEGEGTYQVEVLGRGNQFAAYGEHPDTGQPYLWCDQEPLTAPVEALPAVEPAQLDRLIEALEAWLTDRGLTLEQPGGSGDAAGNHDYCLTDDMQFDVTSPGMGMMTVAELREQLPKGASWECNLTAIRPDSDSEAGRIQWGANDRLCITDFVTGVTYFETLALDEMGAVLGKLLPEPPADGLFGTSPAQTLQKLCETYFHLEADNTVRRLDAPHDAVPFNNFRVARGARLVNAWKDDPRTYKARRLAFRPDRPAGLFAENGETWANSYVPPKHPETGGETETFHRFFEHLVPDAAERDLGLDWIASKIQRPAVPGHGLIMVAARTQGTGRGTLARILGALLGDAYWQNVSFRRVTGREYQAQYNDYLSSTLLVSVPEALDALDYASRRNAYETLKELVEPAARAMLITRKGLSNERETVYASFFFSTNHGDALPLEAEDRRFIVLGNGQPLPDNHPIHDWLQRGENVGALWRELKGRKVKYNPLGLAPVTAAKERMIEAATSDISHAWADFAAGAPGAVATFEHWRAAALARREELDFPRDVGKREDGLRHVWRDRSDAFPKTYRWRGRVVRARIIRDFDYWHDAPAEAVKAELDKNEDAAPKAPGNVVPLR